MQYPHLISRKSLLSTGHTLPVVSSKADASSAALVAHLVGEVCLHSASLNALQRPALLYAPIRAVLAEYQTIAGRLRCSALVVLISGRLPCGARINPSHSLASGLARLLPSQQLLDAFSLTSRRADERFAMLTSPPM